MLEDLLAPSSNSSIIPNLGSSALLTKSQSPIIDSLSTIGNGQSLADPMQALMEHSELPIVKTMSATGATGISLSDLTANSNPGGGTSIDPLFNTPVKAIGATSIDPLFNTPVKAIGATGISSSDVTARPNPGSNGSIGQIFFEKIDPQVLIDSLSKTGSSVSQIGVDLTNLGFDLSTIADGVKHITKSDGTVDGRKLADLLWRKGASPQQMGQTMFHIGFSLETIADAVKFGVIQSDGTGLKDVDEAKALWYSIDPKIAPNKLADLLWNNGASPGEIGRDMKGFGLELETIASAVKFGVTKSDGTHLNYIDEAEALWKSGDPTINPDKVASVLSSTGALPAEIGQALDSLHLGNQVIGDAVYHIASNSADEAVALFKGVYGIDTRQIANVLWNTEKTKLREIVQDLHSLKLSNRVIGDAVYHIPDLKTRHFETIALNYGVDRFTPGQIADALWYTGASQVEIGQQLHSIGLEDQVIGDAVKNGIFKSDGTHPNYMDEAEALWNNGSPKMHSYPLANILAKTGASSAEIAQALHFVKLSNKDIGDAIKFGVTLSNGSHPSYNDEAFGLWNDGSPPSKGELADVLFNSNARSAEIGPALHSVGFSNKEIGNAVRYGITFDDGTHPNYIDEAQTIWKSGSTINSRELADILWKDGAREKEIGRALSSLINPKLSLENITDAVRYGVVKSDNSHPNYDSVASALSAVGGFNLKEFANVLWKSGASPAEIGHALHSAYGDENIYVIGAAVIEGVTKSDGSRLLNYIDEAFAVWKSGASLDVADLANVLWSNGARETEIGQAFYSLGLSLESIAKGVRYGVNKSDGTQPDAASVASALWNSGYSIDGGKVVSILWSQGTSQADIGKALRVLGFSNEDIGYAMKNAPGLKFNYTSIAVAINDSKKNVSNYAIADILNALGGSFDDISGALQEVGVGWFEADRLAGREVFQNIVNNFSDYSKKVYDHYSPGIIDLGDRIANNSVANVLLLPFTLPAEIAKDVVKSTLSGNFEPLLGIAKRIPVLATAVDGIEALYHAATGNEKGVLIDSINGALGFYGGSNVVTPAIVKFAVDIFWELKDKHYEKAITAVLHDLGVDQKVADIFVTVIDSIQSGKDLKLGIKAILNKFEFKHADELVNVAFDIINKNYEDILQTGLKLVGFDSLHIDNAKADTFVKLTLAVRDGKYAQAADILIALSGDSQLVRESSWVKELKGANSTNYRQAIETGLSTLGFENAAKWVDPIFAFKDGKYLDAVAYILNLNSVDFPEGKDFANIIDNLQQEHYLDALSSAFKLTNFPDGQSLADAAVAFKNGNYIQAFYDGLNLVEGGRDVANAFKYLQEVDLHDFVASMIKAAPFIIKYIKNFA